MTTTGPDDRDPLVGAEVDRAWRALSREEPATSLDVSILAAAHREAGARPQSVGAKEAMAARRRWWPLAAAATVAAIAVGVLQLTPQEELGAPAAPHGTVSDIPAPSEKKNEVLPAAPAPPADKTEAVPASPAPPSALASAASRPTRQTTEARTAPPPPAPRAALVTNAPAPEPFPAAKAKADEGAGVAAEPQAASMARKEMAAPPATAGNVAADRLSPAAAPAATGGALAAAGGAPAAPVPERAAQAPAPLAKMAASRADDAGVAARAKDRAPLPIPDWIALIRRLRDEGKTADAAKELAAFRAAHADHEKLLPLDLRDWHPPDR